MPDIPDTLPLTLRPGLDCRTMRNHVVNSYGNITYLATAISVVYSLKLKVVGINNLSCDLIPSL